MVSSIGIPRVAEKGGIKYFATLHNGEAKAIGHWTTVYSTLDPLNPPRARLSVPQRALLKPKLLGLVPRRPAKNGLCPCTRGPFCPRWPEQSGRLEAP